MSNRGRRRGVLLGMVAGILCAGPASGAEVPALHQFTPPTLYVRLVHANSIDHTPVSDWMPLAGSPQLNWLDGYEIGYLFQDNPSYTGNSQRASLTITGVPDGQPTQPLNTPYCSGGPNVVGSIVPVGTAIQFEGTGTYSISVSVGHPSGGPSDCTTGVGSATSTASFTAGGSVAPVVVGKPLVIRSKRLASGVFSGVRAPKPPGGEADTRCARDATVNADGSISGKLKVVPENDLRAVGQIVETDFPRPGAWTCVARGWVEGRDVQIDNFAYGTPWSAPLRFDLQSDFRRSHGVLSKTQTKHPMLTFTAEFPEAAPGGTGALKLKRLVRCRGRNYVFSTVGTFKGRFDSKGKEAVKINRLGESYYIGTLSFGGTRFYTKSVDPNPVLLRVDARHRLGFVSPLQFPQC